MSLSTIKLFNKHKVFKILIISDNLNRILHGSAKQLWSPFFKYTYNGQQFLIIDLVITFLVRHFL